MIDKLHRSIDRQSQGRYLPLRLLIGWCAIALMSYFWLIDYIFTDKEEQFTLWLLLMLMVAGNAALTYGWFRKIQGKSIIPVIEESEQK